MNRVIFKGIQLILYNMQSYKAGDMEYDISHRVLPLLLLCMTLCALLNDVKEMF